MVLKGKREAVLSPQSSVIFVGKKVAFIYSISVANVAKLSTYSGSSQVWRILVPSWIMLRESVQGGET